MNENTILKSRSLENQEIRDEDLDKINKYSLKELQKDELYVFKVVISDNEIDRDFEVFPLESLKKMKDLFVGKTLIKDHQKKSDNQVGRIYDTELIAGTTLTKNGEVYHKLVAYCYMIKTNSNEDLIKEIDAGIKKEVSVSLAINKAVCSICGTDNMKEYCSHWWGKEYDGETCHFRLENPFDAYEVSLVATPANPAATTTKSYKIKSNENNEKKQKLNLEKEKLVSLRLKLLQSFIFAEKGRNEIYE